MPSTSSQTARVVGASIAGVALVAVIGAVTLGAGGRAAAPTAGPSASPSSSPTPSLGTPVPASPAPATPAPASPAPSIGAGDGPVVIVLDTVDVNDPRVTIDDRSGRVIEARSGRAGDGMSTRWNTAIVEQVDPTTIRVTWVGFPGAEDVALTVGETGGHVVLDLDQAGPPANSDALGADRVLVLSFDRAVDADDVEVTFPPLVPAG